MLRLDETQRRMCAAILEQGRPELLDLIEPDGIEPGARLQIYRNHARLTLTEALKATFPVICRLVDARFFSYAAGVFIREHPPSRPCLADYGDNFADFLADFPPCRDLVYLADVARLEWAINAALHAEAAAPLDRSSLREVPPDDAADLVLRLHPSLRLAASDWPVDRIWHANQTDTGSGTAVDLSSGAVRLRIHRSTDRVVVERIEDGAFGFLAAIIEGARLERAAEAAQRTDPTFDLAAQLRALLDQGLVVGWHIAPEVAEPGAEL